MKQNKKILRILKLNKNDNFNNDIYIKFINLYKVLNYKRFNYSDK